jgi:hypothetical protein
MPRTILVAVFAGIANLAAMSLCWAAEVPSNTYLGSCGAVEGSADADGVASEAAALKFILSLAAGDTSSARSMMTAAARKNTTAVQLAAVADAIKAMRPAGEPAVSTAYVLKLSRAPIDIAHVPCLAPGPNRGADFVAAGPAAKQAHVLFTTATIGDGVSVYAVWLQVEDGDWNVAGFHIDPSLMGGRDAFAWWEAAKKQKQENHDFNAALLYGTARSLLSRGPYYQPAGLADLLQEIETLRVPDELKGQPPLSWTLDDQRFAVVSVAPTGVPGGKVVLALVQQSSGWASDQEADQQNHRLIDAFMKVHPEWVEIFDYLAARTCKPDFSLCFGSMYAKGTGYMKNPS